MLKNWSDAQITEKERLLTQRLQKDAERLCLIAERSQRGLSDGSPQNEEGISSQKVVQRGLEGRPHWEKMRSKKG
jgi:hypothetical protein